jgi:hypothetical protein
MMALGDSWGEFFVRLGRGEARQLPIGGGFGCAVRIFGPAAPGLPVKAPIRFEGRIRPKDIYLDKGKLKAVGNEDCSHLCGLFEATAEDRTIKQAMAEIYDDLIPQITVPDISYRNDIGEKAEKDVELLEAWGYEVVKDIRRTVAVVVAGEIA